MKDISYHILDIVQNSLNAGATLIRIELIEKTGEGTFTLSIADNGKGMSNEKMNRVTDAFYTTSNTKKVGLGIPLLKQNAELTGGSFRIMSVLNKGTHVVANFNKEHLDMIPMGNLPMTFRMLVAANPDIDFRYRHCKDSVSFEFDTAEIRRELGDIRLNEKEVLDYISDYICNSLNDISININ